MKKTAIFVVISIGILFIAVSALIAISIYIDNLSRIDDHTFNLEESEGAWEMLWEKHNPYLGRYLGGRNQFVVTMNTLCYVAPEEDSFFRKISLICVDIHDGKQKWIGQIDAYSDVASDETQVYGGGGDGFNDDHRISAYNAETGQEVWHKWIDTKSVTQVTAYNGFVGVHGSSTTFDVFDASNGSLQSRDSVPIMTYHSFANDGQKLFEQFAERIEATNLQDNSSIWTAYFENHIVYDTPVFSNGLIIVRTGGEHRGMIEVIDSKTGSLLWEKEGVVSDFGVNDETLFFMTMQGEVLAVDVETGETQGRLVLDDAKLNAQEYEFADFSEYFVRATDDVVIFYLGDTGQLFSFRYSNE